MCGASFRLEEEGHTNELERLRIDPRPKLAASDNAAIAYFARRDLLQRRVPAVSTLWELEGARRILARQQADGSWRSGKTPRSKYDQMETFRNVAILVEQYGFTRAHPAIERAALFLLSAQTDDGDLRGIYGAEFATSYVGAIVELLVKAGFADDPRIDRVFAWLSRMRQSDGGWAIPARTAGVPFSQLVKTTRTRRKPCAPDVTKPSSHLVTGMVLRAYAAHPTRRKSEEARSAATWFAARLYRRDAYGDRGAVAYWERVSFPFWFTDIVSALDALGRIGVATSTPAVLHAIERVRSLQRDDGTFAFELLRASTKNRAELPSWIALAVCRALLRFRSAPRK